MLYCGKCGVEILEHINKEFKGVCPKCAWIAQLVGGPEEERDREALKRFRPEIKVYARDYVKNLKYLLILFIVVFVFIAVLQFFFNKMF